MAKKKGNTWIWFLAGAALLFGGGFATTQAVRNRLLISFPNIKVKKIGKGISTKIQFTLNYSVTNNNPVGVSVLSFFGTIYYQRNRLIDIQLKQPFSIKAGQTKTLTLTEETHILNVVGAGLQNIGTLIDNKGIPDLEVNLVGDMNTDFAALPAISIDTTIPFIT